MTNSLTLKTLACCVAVFGLGWLASSAHAADQAGIADLLQGRWVANDELSDDTDDRVEEAIKASGGKGRGLFSRGKEDYYRAAPGQRDLYDRVSYDDVLTISYDAPEFRFVYENGYQRVFYSDGRRRRVSANEFFEEGAQDYSLSHFEDNALIVEARPQDGGFTLETYTVSPDGKRLTVVMTIQPDNFGTAVELTRVFDRAG